MNCIYCLQRPAEIGVRCGPCTDYLAVLHHQGLKHPPTKAYRSQIITLAVERHNRHERQNCVSHRAA